jgi:hypothetical protein
MYVSGVDNENSNLTGVINFERKILRNIFGLNKEAERFRGIKTKDELIN